MAVANDPSATFLVVGIILGIAVIVYILYMIYDSVG